MIGKLRNNFIADVYVRIWRLLTSAQRRRAVVLTGLSVVGAFTEVLGLAVLVPVIMAATDPEWIHDNFAMKWLYALGNFKSDAKFMVFLSVMLLLVFIFKNAIALGLYARQSKFAYDIGTDLSRRMFIKFYNRGFTFFKNTNSAEIQNQVMNIPMFFSSAILISAINFLVETLVVLLVVAGIAATDWRLFIGLVLVLGPTSILIYNSTKNKLHQLGHGQAKIYNQVFGKLSQSVFGYTDVRIHNKEQVFLDAYYNLTKEYNRANQVRYVLNLIPPRALEVISILGISITFIYTFLFIEDPKQVFSFIAVFAAAAFRILPSFSRLMVAIMGMRSHQYALDYLEDGELPHELTMTQVRPMAFDREISFKDLTLRFDDTGTVAVKNLSLSVKKGEKVGIIGESGSGKTTLMNILLRFLEETDGGMYVDDVKLGADDKASWRAMVGYVKQDVFLMDATLQENVAFGEPLGKIDQVRLWEALEGASLTKYVESLPEGVNTIVGEHGSKVSGGQKQRIGIARALYSRAKVLVFDEATSALDSETEQAITESIEQLKGGQTIFVIAHRISTLRFCDRIIEMKNGEVVGIHTYDELLRR